MGFDENTQQLTPTQPFDPVAALGGDAPAPTVTQSPYDAAQTQAAPAPENPSVGPQQRPGMSKTIAQNTLVANKVNPGNWSQNVISGVMSALAGFGVTGEAPVGAGIFSGIGKAVAQRQAMKQKRLENTMEQKKIDLEQQKNDMEKAKIAPTVAEQNSRTALNTAQAERYGVESIKDQIEISRPLISRAQDAGLYDRGNVAQADILKGLKDKTIDPVTIGPVDGFTMDANGKPEATHALLKNPSTPVKLEQSDVDSFAKNHVNVLDSKSPIAEGQTISLAQFGQYTQQAGSNKIFMSTLNDVNSALGITTDEKKKNEVFADKGTASAIQKFSHYLGAAGGDPFKAAMAMSAQTRIDPKTGAVEPNPDAGGGQKIVDSFGGWDNLRKYERIQLTKAAEASGLTVEKALSITSSAPGEYSPTEKKQASDFLHNEREHEALKAVDKANAEATASEEHNPGEKDLAGPAYLQSLPKGMQGTVTALAEGRQDMTALPRGKEKQTYTNALNQAYPGFDESEQKAYFNARNKYSTAAGSTSPGFAINAGQAAFTHLNDLAKMNTAESRVVGSKEYQDYQAQMTVVSDELAKFYGNTALPSMDAFHQSLSAFANRGAAIRTLAGAMDVKMNEYQTQWNDVIPKYLKLSDPNHLPPMPGVSQTAMRDRASVLGTPMPNVPSPPQSGASRVHANLTDFKNTVDHNGQTYYTDDGHVMYDANGNVVK